jgi:hypothetical protein
MEVDPREEYRFMEVLRWRKIVTATVCCGRIVTFCAAKSPTYEPP